MTTYNRDQSILLAHKVFGLERDISVKQRAIQIARENLAKSKEAYQKAVAVAVGCGVNDLQFSDSMACFGTKLVMHCVWDKRANPHWPLCIFCGSPRDGC